MKNKLTFTLFFLVALFIGVRAYYKLTDDFRISNMTYELPHHQEWEIADLENQESINQILNQKFTYLGKGAQSYVFTSDDGQYVIKFFKFKHLKPSFLVNALPSVFPFAEYKENVTLRKKRKLNHVFNGYHLAFETHKEEAGLIYIHLNKTDFLKKSVTVIDKIGFTHEIDLDQNVFLLQKKGETLRTTIRNLLNEKNIQLVKKRIRQIFDLYVSEYKKGIYDHDHGVMNNTGFIGDEPIHLDVGKFLKAEHMRESIVYKDDLKIIYHKIDLWLKKHYPNYHEELVKDMNEKYLESI